MEHLTFWGVLAGGDGPDLVQLLVVEGLGTGVVRAPPRAEARLPHAAQPGGPQGTKGRTLLSAFCRQACGRPLTL